MKSIKKKLVPFLCLIVSVFALSSCSKGLVLGEEEQFAADWVTGWVSSMGENQAILPLALSQYAEVPVQYDSILNFIKIGEKLGAYQGFELTGITENDPDVYLVKGLVHFEERDAECSMEIGIGITAENRETGEITYAVVSAEATAFDMVKTFGEKMSNAAMNTLMGMGVVFVVLILISFIISLFSLIGKYEEKKARKETPEAPAAPKAPVIQEEEETDDTELVAVIAAAIAEFEGTSPDGIVVRSIRKVSSSNTWKRGY